MSGTTNNAQLTLLDCTLRDGGYYNDWDFATPLIDRYLHAMAQSRVPVVELGFRFLEPTGYAGPTAHTTDAFINDLTIPANITLGVMLNAKDLVTYSGGPSAAIDKLFAPASDSQVNLVRIATTWNELSNLRSATDRLIELGYTIGVNLMQVHARSARELAEFGTWCATANVAVAYFADSFGGLYPSDIAPIVNGISSTFAGPIDCHLHDNLSLAMANSLAAIDAGVTWVDSTIRGMGRGPGNARTEYLAVELSRRNMLDLDVQPLLGLVTDDFALLHDEYGWGTNLFYVLSACNGVHPTYVQNMLGDSRFDTADIVAAIEELGKSGGASYSMDRATAAAAASMSSTSGSWDATGWCDGRDVLIVGPGDSVRDRRHDIEKYIARVRPTVINLNLTPLVDPHLIDAYVVCNPMRAKLDLLHLPEDSTPVITPDAIGTLIYVSRPHQPVQAFGFDVSPGTFSIDASQCSIPHGIVTAYALAVAARGGARSISLVGLDGFPVSDPRHSVMVDVFDSFARIDGTPPIGSLTPTSYPVRASSLYAPAES
ncbi:MAG: aldolase [Actinomycetota bacterium]